MKPSRIAFALPLLLAVLLAAAPAPVLADSVLDRAREAVRDAGRKIHEAAKEAGRSVRDLLTDNPDLNRDIVDFGEQVGVPGFEGARPATGPSLALSVPEAAVGAEVVVTAAGLPGETPVTVAAGPNANETRRLAEARTDPRGDLIATVAVPEAPATGDRLVFVVETADGRVRLVSEPFRVAPASAAIIVTGTLSTEGVECPALRGDDGKLYTLTPRDLGTFGPGDRVSVKGTVAQISICMQGATIAVSSITAAN